MNLSHVLILVFTISSAFAGQQQQQQQQQQPGFSASLKLGSSPSSSSQHQQQQGSGSEEEYDEEPYVIRRTIVKEGGESSSSSKKSESEGNNNNDYPVQDAESYFDSGIPGAAVVIGNSVADSVETAANSSSNAVKDIFHAIGNISEAGVSLIEEMHEDESEGLHDVVDGLVEVASDLLSGVAGIAGDETKESVENALDNTGKMLSDWIDSVYDAKSGLANGFLDWVTGLNGVGNSIGSLLKSQGLSSASAIDNFSNTWAKMLHMHDDNWASFFDNLGDLTGLLPQQWGQVMSDIAYAANRDSSAEMYESAAEALTKVFHSDVLGNFVRSLDGARTVQVFDGADDVDPETLILSQDEETRKFELKELAKFGQLSQTTRNGWKLVTKEGETQKSGRTRPGRKSNSGGTLEFRMNGGSNKLGRSFRNIVDGLLGPISRMTSRNDDYEDYDYNFGRRRSRSHSRRNIRNNNNRRNNRSGGRRRQSGRRQSSASMSGQGGGASFSMQVGSGSGGSQQQQQQNGHGQQQQQQSGARVQYRSQPQEQQVIYRQPQAQVIYRQPQQQQQQQVGSGQQQQQQSYARQPQVIQTYVHPAYAGQQQQQQGQGGLKFRAQIGGQQQQQQQGAGAGQQQQQQESGKGSQQQQEQQSSGKGGQQQQQQEKESGISISASTGPKSGGQQQQQEGGSGQQQQEQEKSAGMTISSKGSKSGGQQQQQQEGGGASLKISTKGQGQQQKQQGGSGQQQQQQQGNSGQQQQQEGGLLSLLNDGITLNIGGDQQQQQQQQQQPAFQFNLGK